MKRNIIVALILGVFLSVSCSLIAYAAYTANDQVTQAQLDAYPYWIEVIQPNYNSNQHTILRSAAPISASFFKLCTDGSGKRVLYIDSLSFNLIYCDYWVNVSEGWTNYSQPSNIFGRGGYDDSRWYVNVINGNYSVYDFTYIPPATVEVFVGDSLINKASSSQNNLNSIEGFTDIRVLWENQPLAEKMFKLDIAYSSYWDNLIHNNTVVNIKTKNNEMSYTLGKPKLENEVMYYILYVYNSTGVFSDPLLGKYDKYYFKYTSLTKPTLNITGVVDGSTVYDRPSVVVSKQNSDKAYKVYINNHEIYNFTSTKNASYSIPQNYYDYGLNSVAVYDSLNLVKSVSFELKYDDVGGETGPWGWGNGEDGPPDDYQPAPIDDGKPEKPLPDDEYYKWIYYYLQLIIFYLELPFRLLLGLLKDVVKSIVDNINQLKTSYDSMFTASKLLFGFLPSPIVYLICLGMALSLALWFLGNVRRLK